MAVVTVLLVRERGSGQGADILVRVNTKEDWLYFADWTESTTVQELQDWAEATVARLIALRQKEDDKETLADVNIDKNEFLAWTKANLDRPEVRQPLKEIARIYVREEL